MSNEDLVLRIQAGENVRQNLELLYRQNKGLIGLIVRKYHGYAEDEDLFQSGYLGLHKAVFLWDPAEGAAFATYALLLIRQAITQYVAQGGSLVRIPEQKRLQLRQYRQTVNSYQQNLNRDPTREELTAALEVSADKIEELRSIERLLSPRSTEEPIADEEDGLTLGDTVADPVDRIQETEDRLDNGELSRVLWDLVDDCGERESKLIRDRYQRNMTQKECSEVMGVSLARAQQIEQEALKKLRYGKSGKRLRDLYEKALARSMHNTGQRSYRRTGNSQQEAFILNLERFKVLFPENESRIDEIIDRVIDAIADE